jgi:hypothetical protein
MTKEDKKLLFRYLSMALPYGVKVQEFDNTYGYKLLGIDGDVLHIDCPVYDEGDGYVEVEYCKAYLRPMSSMTEEERTEINALIKQNSPSPYGKINLQGMDNLLYSVVVSSGFLMDWMLKKHFDIFDLIPKELAIAVTKENNPYNTAEE